MNVNDNSPVISSGSGFSVDENKLSIGNIIATDLDGDTLIYSVSGSELAISNSGALTFADSNGADFETQSTYIAVVTVTDGIFNAEQTIIITVQDTNDNFPVVTSSSFTPNENLVVIGTVTATDDDANSSLSYSISGSDTIRDGEAYLDIDSSTGEISVSSGRGILDYETKSSYSFDVSVTDGTNVTTETVTVAVQNILEDVISYNFSISDGTLTQPPVLQATIVIDELTMAKKVYADLTQVQSSADFRCDGWGYEVLEMTKSSATEWTLTHELSDEASELCRYALNFYINPFDETSETAPPTDGIHLSSGNKRLNDNSLQYSIFYEPYPDYEVSDLTTINNVNSDNTIDKTVCSVDGVCDIEETLFFYIFNAQGPSAYPSECNVNQYEISMRQDASGTTENFITPYIAALDPNCATAMTTNSSTDPDKVKYQYFFYSIEPMKKFYSYMFSPNKAYWNQERDGKGGTSSRELLVSMGNISTVNPRIAVVSYEFDKAFLPATLNDDTTAFIYLEPSDESGAWLYNNLISIDLSNSLVGDESDIFPPEINAITTSSYTTADYPQRNFIKFDVDITNDAPSGALTSVRDLWITYRGGPRCDSQIVSYVRDDLDGKIDTSINRLSATIPFLKNDEGTYEIVTANINDHGYAEYIYYDYRYDFSNGERVDRENASFIGQTFTVGDGSNITCPYFSNYYNLALVEVNEGETFIGNFSAQGSSNDTITYSLADLLIDGEEGTGISSLVQISSNGVLSYVNPMDYDTDTHGRIADAKGGVLITATSSLDPSLSRELQVEVTLVNLNDETPVITSSANFSVDEGETEVGCIAVTDADKGGTIPAHDGVNCGNVYPLTYSIAGDNLEIDTYGRISFTSAPDYETKSLYTGNISVSDGVNSTDQDITININDLNDNDPVVGNSSFTVNENQLVVGQVSVTDQDTNNTFTYSIVSDYEDGAKFAIDTDGNITFVNNPDFENQSIYKLKVNVSDGQTTVVQEYTVTLNDVIAEAIPTFADINLLPKTINSSTIQLQSFVVEGRIATFSIEQDASFGTSSLNSTSGELLYQTSSADVATDELTFKVNDGAGNESTAKLTINLNTDPLYKYQWHLDNTGQTNFASTPGVILEDMNIKDVIASGYTGLGLTISVIDEGLEIAHEDLAPNVLTGKSYNFLDGSNDPTSLNLDGDHGTSVAGIIASKGWNNIGGRGVAPNANLVGYNYLESQANSNESYSLGLDNNLVSADIFNMSYGRFLYPSSNNFSFPNNLWGPPIVLDGFINGVNNLRNGKGGIYIKSMGNDYSSNATNGSACGEEGVDEEGAMTCGIEFHDFRHLHPYIIGVGALGADGIKSSYSTVGPSIWVSSPGGEYGYNTELGWSGAARFFEPAIMTTDQSSCDVGYVSQYSSNRNAFNNSSNPHPDNLECKYTSGFNGTSSAAPNVAGGIAVLLEAYPNLTWREVKHVIANSSRKIDVNRKYVRSNITQYEWRENAAGYNFHNWYGFGAFDLEAALEFSSNFILNSLGTFSNYGWAYSPDSTKNQLIPSLSLIENSIDYQPDTSNNFVEFIQLAIYLTKDTPRDLGFSLVSPQGTEMNIIQPFTNVSGNPNGEWFVVGVSGFYGENLKGEWKLKVIDYTNNSDEGILNDWGINIYGN